MKIGGKTVGRRLALGALLCLALLICSGPRALAEADPLPSWNDGPARRAIISFVSAVTQPSSPDFIPEGERIATFDMDGTLWVEQPVYAEVDFAYDRLAARAAADPSLASAEPFRGILDRGRADLPALGGGDLDALLTFAMSGMTVDAFTAEVRTWLTTARQACWNVPPTRLFYQPMREVMAYFEAHGFTNYIVTGSGQDFVRSFARNALGVPPGHVVGTARLARFARDGNGPPQLVAGANVLLTVAGPAKPEAIHLFIGQRPVAAFGNSSGDADMLDYATARKGRSLAMLVLHDDGAREYAYGPALGLPDTAIGAFSQALFDRARNSGWHVISMRNDWRVVLTGVKKEAAAPPSVGCALPGGLAAP